MRREPMAYLSLTAERHRTARLAVWHLHNLAATKALARGWVRENHGTATLRLARTGIVLFAVKPSRRRARHG